METTIHHQLNHSKITEINEHDQMMTSFFKSHGNSFFLDDNYQKLTNFVTQVYADRDIAKMHLNFFDETEVP